MNGTAVSRQNCYFNPKMDIRGPRGPRATSNFCSTLTISRTTKIFYVILNKTEYNKIATCLFLCAIYFPCRTPLSTILGQGPRGPRTILNEHPT